MSSLFDVVAFIERINIITIVFFVFTLCLVIYEWILFRKGRVSNAPLRIPTFDKNSAPSVLSDIQSHHATPIVSDTHKVYEHRTQLIVVGIIIILSLSATIGGFFINKKEPPVEKPFSQNSSAQTATSLSQGVVIYSDAWKPLSSGEIANLSSDDEIYLTIDTKNTKEFNKARIRVNEEVWYPEHETTLYDKSHHVYYRTYTIPENESQLKIDAQLHSVTYGWPLAN